MSDTDNKLPDPIAALEDGENIELPTPEDLSLPEGEEAQALSAGEMRKQVEQAEQLGEMMTSIQNIVERYGGQLDELNGKVREIRESLANLFANNDELQEIEQQEKAIKSDVKAKKQRIKESPEAVQLQMKIKELQEEANEIKKTISNHLIRYYQMTGSQVIETSDGQEREFTVSARLKGKTKSE